jgi:ubiquinone/menaquinone biosynthesis C-methylase UbiE
MTRQIKRKQWFTIAAICIAAAMAAFALTLHVSADAAGEMARLAKLMGWKPGTVVADIGAGDGRYSFAAAEIVGESGKVFATEIDEEKLRTLRSEVKERGLRNVDIVESADATTNLPGACCDAIFLRRVYHHLTKPLPFDTSLLLALKPGGKLAIIDFPPHPEYGKVKGVPKDRENHGIQQKILIDELTKAGFALDSVVDDWPTSDYCVLFQKK